MVVRAAPAALRLVLLGILLIAAHAPVNAAAAVLVQPYEPVLTARFGAFFAGQLKMARPDRPGRAHGPRQHPTRLQRLYGGDARLTVKPRLQRLCQWHRDYLDRGADYHVRIHTAASRHLVRWRRSAALPFLNIGSRRDDDSFADGLAEELIHRLHSRSRAPGHRAHVGVSVTYVMRITHLV